MVPNKKIIDPFELGRNNKHAPKFWINSTIDIALNILKHRINIKNSLSKDEFLINEQITRELLGRNIWKYSEAFGKFKGCPFWSVKAFNHFIKMKKEGAMKSQREKLLRHEHVFPQIMLIQMMKNLKNPDKKTLELLFSTYAIATVVTVDENDALNKAGLRQSTPSKDNIWLRYKKIGIEIKNNKLKNIFFNFHLNKINEINLLK